MTRPTRKPAPEAAELPPLPEGVIPIADALEPEMERIRDRQAVSGSLEPLAVGLDKIPGLLGVSRRSIERARARGDFPKPTRMIGKRPIWAYATIRAWAEGGEP